MINDFLYENETDEDEFLSMVPLNLTKESLLYQVSHPSEQKVDLVQTFIHGYNYSKSVVSDEDGRLELVSMRDDFLGFFEQLMYRMLSIGYPDLRDLPENEQNDLIHFSYRYFIIQMRENFVNLITNYIIDHLDEIRSSGLKRKDVSTIVYKKEFGDLEDASIIANLSGIIRNILTESDLTIDEFLILSQSDYPTMENTFVKEMYDTFQITGNFVSNYVLMIPPTMMVEIETRVRGKLLRKFRQMERRTPVVNNDDEESSENNIPEITEEESEE